jgi:hypothetical protein
MVDERDRLTRSESGPGGAAASNAAEACCLDDKCADVGDGRRVVFARADLGGCLPLLLDWDIVFILSGFLHLPDGGDRDVLRSERYREPGAARKPGIERPRIMEEGRVGTAILAADSQSSGSAERALALDGAVGLPVEGLGSGERARSLTGGEAEPSPAPGQPALD